MSRALVVFSGGMDSSTCLAWALERFGHVETIGFDYGQRHAIELTCRDGIRSGIAGLNPVWAERLGPDHCLDLKVIAEIGGSAMTEEATIGMTGEGLPTTFVPGRNLLFFTSAAAVTYRRSIRHLVGGTGQSGERVMPHWLPSCQSLRRRFTMTPNHYRVYLLILFLS